MEWVDWDEVSGVWWERNHELHTSRLHRLGWPWLGERIDKNGQWAGFQLAGGVWPLVAGVGRR